MSLAKKATVQQFSICNSADSGYIYGTMQAAIVHVQLYAVLLYLLHENLHTEKRIHAIIPTKWVAAKDCCELIICSRVHTAGEEKEVQYNTAVVQQYKTC